MNSVPLTDTLPWGFDKPPVGGRTVLICDSAETDGRFVLHTIVSQCLSPSKKSPSTAKKETPYNVIWINCGTKTEGQIRQAIKKIGCDIKSNADSLYVTSIIPQLCEQLPEKAELGLCNEDLLKIIYQDVKRRTSSLSKYVIIIDSCSSLSTYFGAPLTFHFVQKMRTLVRKDSRRKDNSLILLASHDLDQEHYISSGNHAQRNVVGMKKMQYIGAGGRGIICDAESMASMELDAAYELNETAWERALIEISDGVVDVVPLASGFAKDVHGRLVFTCRQGSGLGWKKEDETSQVKKKFSTSLVNYCCSDAGVRSIRLRVG